MPVIPNTDHHVGDIKSYLLKIHTFTPLLKSLIAELKTITKGVDPDEGYSNTLINLANRMQMNEAMLMKELGVQVRDSQRYTPSPKEATFSPECVAIACFTDRRSDYRNFL
jgi:hypothetical protein